MKKPLALLGVSAVVGFGALLIGGPAQAGAASPTCPQWNLRSIVDEWGAPAEGSIVTDEQTVTLVKPNGGGTEFATGDAGLNLSGTTSITVDYELNGTASFSAGAVRLFYYHAVDANTVSDAPTDFKAADDNEGTLTLSGVSGHVGTLGLVYDASNSAGGSVTFTNLKIGDIPVAFKDVCTSSPSPSATSPSATTSPSPSTTAAPTTAAPQPTTTANPTTSPASGGLPVTGDSNGKKVAAAGGLAIVVGAIAVVVARKRRETKFIAE